MIGKNKIETMCRNAGMRPVKRDNINGAEVFIADGFSPPPHLNFRRFGVEATDFPLGMYATLWWVSKGDEKLDTGQPLFFDSMHDPQIGRGSKQLARINSALKEAKSFLQKRRKARLNG
jgi:hypothetical protein